MVILSTMSIWDITGAVFFDCAEIIKITYIITFSILKATGITIIYCICRHSLVLKTIFWFIIIGFTILSIINFVSFSLYGFGITRKLINIFAQTTPLEILGFLPGLIQNIYSILSGWKFYVILFIIIISAKFIEKCRTNLFVLVIFLGSIIGTSGFITYSLTFTSGRSAHLIYLRLVKFSYEVYLWNQKYENLIKQTKPLPDASSVSTNYSAETVIVVIGESAIRGHHSLYGYPLPTNPRLEILSDSLFIFTDAISSSKSTAGNMERILSFKKDDTTEGDGLEYPLLIDFFNQAGYKTFWLSNQERVGSVSNTSGVMTMNANVIKYLGAENSEDAICAKYDEVLLPHFKHAMKDQSQYKLIFCHLLGSHVEYKDRYPKSFQYFNSKIERKTFQWDWLDEQRAKRRADYDNSIRYTDSILAKMIYIVANTKTPSVIIYFSDHGEDVFDKSAFSGRNEHCAEIPFFIYANASYREKNPELITMINNSLYKPFSSANLVHMLISLTGSKYKHYNSYLDPLSPSYLVRPRYVDERIWPLEHIDQ